MFAKPLSLILVYIITVINITVLTLPFLAGLIPFVDFKNNVITIESGIFYKLKFGFFLIMFSISFLMLFFFVIDFLFGFSLRSSLKNCTRYEKIKDYEFLTELFNQVKNKFGEKGVRLYIKDSEEVNAFAVSSVGSKVIVLTRGLINHYLIECPDPKSFLYALRSVIGHEMSHLVNKDFLPTFLIIINQKATNFISNFLYLIFNLGVRATSMLPYGGRSSARLIFNTYSLLNFVLTAFNRLVVYNVYELLRRFISRSVEFRCDRQSAKAFGGQNMSLALSMLGESGYFTLFSTHPGSRSRMKKVENVKMIDDVVRPRFVDSLANYFAMMFLIIVCLYFAKQAHVDLMVRDYIRHHEVINQKLMMLWRLISSYIR